MAVDAKQRERDEIARLIAEFEAQGGIIEVLPMTQRSGYTERFNPFFDPDSED